MVLLGSRASLLIQHFPFVAYNTEFPIARRPSISNKDNRWPFLNIESVVEARSR